MHEYVLSGFEEQLEQIRKASKKVSQSFTVYKVMPIIKKARNMMLAQIKNEYISNRISSEDYKDITGRIPDSRLEKMKKNFPNRKIPTDNKKFSYVQELAKKEIEKMNKDS